MPVYVYEIIRPGNEGKPALFEVTQSMRDPALTTHPETGEPVRRVFMPPHLTTKHGERGAKAKLEAGNLEKHGFTRYEKDTSGTYHRTAGKEGPSTITP